MSDHIYVKPGGEASVPDAHSPVYLHVLPALLKHTCVSRCLLGCECIHVPTRVTFCERKLNSQRSAKPWRWCGIANTLPPHWKLLALPRRGLRWECAYNLPYSPSIKWYDLSCCVATEDWVRCRCATQKPQKRWAFWLYHCHRHLWVLAPLCAFSSGSLRASPVYRTTSVLLGV